MKYAIVFCVLASATLQAAEQPATSRPLSPQEAAKKFVLDEDCRIELVSSEPHVIDPVGLTFAPDGRLWVVEYSDYPNGPDEGEPGRSRIRILEDKDGDGQFENSKIFADQLIFANGLLLWKDGVIVTTNGKILFLRDTNNDGRADDSQVWFEGFATRNPQLRCNHPTLGMDNRIYVANGLRGGKIVPGAGNPWNLDPASKPISLSGMDFRFDPMTGEYEAISGMGQFGLTMNDWGDRFLCDNRHPCKQIILEDDAVKRVPWLQPKQVFFDVSPQGENSRLYPISRTWTTSNLHANQFTAACGVTIYRGNALVDRFSGNSFTCEPTANLIHRDVIEPQLVTYQAVPSTSQVEFLATRDEWFRPVNLAHGPDGALYVCDMYRAVIEHPQFMPTELKERPDLLLGIDKGRIWRITGKSSQASAPVDSHLQDLSSLELVKFLKHPNVWQRETAQRLLLERQDASVEAALVELLHDVQNRWGGNRALWTLAALKVLKAEHIAAGLKHPFAMRSAMQLGRRSFSDSSAFQEYPQKQLASPLPTEDPHLFENMLLNYTWNEFPDVPRTDDAYFKSPRGAAIALIAQDSPDHWYCSYLVINAGEHLLEVCEEVFHVLRSDRTGDESKTAKAPQIKKESLEFLSAALARRNKPEERQQFLEVVFDAAPTSEARSWQRAALLGLLQSSRSARSWLPQTLAKLSPAAKKHYDVCMDEVVKSFTADSSSKLTGQVSELPLLGLLAPEKSLPILKALATSTDLSKSTAAIDVLRSLPGATSAPFLVELLPGGTPQVRRSVISALASSSEGRDLLLDAVESKEVPPLELDPGTQRIFKSVKDKKQRARAAKLLRQAPPEDRLKVLADYQSSLKMTADPKRGKVVFEKNCATCHKIGKVGVNVAPDISDSRTKTAEFLLTNILDPNRAIDNNYFSFTIADTEGRVHTGVIASETSTAVTLKQPEGKLVTIPREEIEVMRNNGVSLMPVGLERTIPKQDMADLISFIKNWRYLDGQVPKEVIQK